MTIESSVTFISDLNPAYPGASDLKAEGDDHIRNLKTAVKGTFPNVAGAVTPTHTQLNYVAGVTSAIQTQLDAKVGSVSVAGLAPLAAPVFTNYASFPVTTNTVSGIAMYPGDAFTVDTDKLIDHYGLSWKVFSDATAGASVALSGYGGVRIYVLGAQQLRINNGSASFAGSVSATSFSGALSGNISQFTNDAGYVTSTGAAAAGALTGTTLASNVVTSSLTSVGTLSSLTVSSPIVGSVTGSSSSCTGNAATSTSSSSVSNSTSNGYGTRTVSTATASGGADGDVWYQY